MRGVGEANMATLWETTVFSLSSKSWNTSGFRAFFVSVAADLVSEAL